MKKLIVLASMMLVTRLTAQVRIGEKDALSTAERFLKDNAKEQVSDPTLHEVVNSGLSGEPNLFLFSIEPQGFVIVAANDEVLAYSFTSDLPSDDMTAFGYWLDAFNNRTDYLIEHPDRLTKKAGYTEVEPLLTSCWGQGCYHNEACPTDPEGPCGHVSAGCVAVAMAQIMYYHKYPAAGYQSISYSSWQYGILSADFSSTVYHWERMVDTLHGSNPAVATLIYHCGLSAGMAYSANLSVASSTDAANAFCHYFLYPDAKLTRRKDVDDENWTAMVKKDLDAHLPVYYGGGSAQGRHAFVCDGYDTNGLFHFNFGWDGVGDGYYAIDDPSGFSESQLIIHVSPNMPTINIETDICEGESYYFCGMLLTEAGHYSVIYGKKDYELDLRMLPLPETRCTRDTIIPYGSSIQLTATGADTYLWSTGDTTATITVAPEKETTYIVTGYSSTGCSSTSRVKVRIDTTKKLLLYPNPAGNTTTVNMHELDEVSLYDLFGKRVAHADAHRHAVHLDLSDIPNGVYVVEAKQLKNCYYDKLIVCH